MKPGGNGSRLTVIRGGAVSLDHFRPRLLEVQRSQAVALPCAYRVGYPLAEHAVQRHGDTVLELAEWAPAVEYFDQAT